MARGFGATYGSGSTDKIASSLSDGATFSWFGWIYPHGSGGGAFGRMFEHLSHSYVYGGGAVYVFVNLHLTTDGGWTFTPPSLDSWHSLGISYDNSSSTNDPIVYLDGSKLTVGSGLTEISTPAGSGRTAAGTLSIGNRSGNDRSWDGMIAEFAAWTVILDDNEFNALSDGLSPAMIRPQSLVVHTPLVRDNVSCLSAPPTITGTAVQPHPRIYYPRRRSIITAPAAAGATIPIFARHYRQMSQRRVA